MIKQRLVQDWYKKWSVWLTTVAGTVALGEQLLPGLKEVLPGNWYLYAFVVIGVARVLKQSQEVQHVQ